ncbi:hypothetical protein [Tuwongella immobilis]|uniref:Uncharacterized protein n=1 Tax=Tuwongella immobilis TaxID=692036 RepID=A0A6C2YTS1_9BACT|nr:hypothetical protein [Tuwongella immobilis]VIP04523.1 unnamed protein product [Tuwongella immobilis]VTS06407.1 unnamed protein product [Tuwongella immobilis]
MTPANPRPNPDAILSEAELDTLLKRFFASEQPQPWPAAPRPAVAQPASASIVRRSTPQNAPARTLALCLGLLLALCWFASQSTGISGTTAPGANPSLLNGSEATVPVDLMRMQVDPGILPAGKPLPQKKPTFSPKSN